MSAHQSFLQSRAQLAHKLEVLVASVEDIFDAQAALFARAVFREEMEHLSLETEDFTRRLTVRQQELDEINARLERLIYECEDAALQHDPDESTETEKYSREALIDLIHSFPSTSVP